MNSNTLGLLGAVIGFSIVFAFIIFSNKDIKEELESQTRSVLKSTGKIVRHYGKAANIIASGDSRDAGANEEYSRAWDSIPVR